MDNASIADNFSLLSKLMDINGENTFKSKTYSIAAFNIDKLDIKLKDVPRENLFSVKGIGQSVGNKIIEMLDTGRLAVLDEIISTTPPGVIEMLNIKGIGPKKIHTIWKEMEIESVGELQYACNENRLTLFKGFGEKTQKNVLEAIEFYFQNQGSYLYAEIDAVYPQVKMYLEKLFSAEKVFTTGAYRRQQDIVTALEFVIAETKETIKPKFLTQYPPDLLEETDDSLLYQLKNGLKLHLYTGKEKVGEKIFRTSSTEEFYTAFTKRFGENLFDPKQTEGENTIFEKAGIPFICPCLRNNENIIEKAEKNGLPDLIQPEDIKGIIHSHSTWSDGSNTIEEMAKECISKGFEYLVISDHSKAAAYAKGLSEERIKEQHKQIEELNKKLSPFKIFKSIECDILNDGTLDYDNNTLASFDLVIASVHSNLKMTEDKAMMRLLKAIENPFTTILGHITGRLLLSRAGYPVDHIKIIEACADNNVVIEINAHPRRLDIDWKWIETAMKKNVLLSIDPDAHSISGYNDVKYGVLSSQKGGLTKSFNLSSLNLKEFEKHILQRKKIKGI